MRVGTEGVGGGCGKLGGQGRDQRTGQGVKQRQGKFDPCPVNGADLAMPLSLLHLQYGMKI